MRYANFHTHTTYSDGNHTLEENVLSAIKKNMSILGFSDHSFTACDTSYCMKKEEYETYCKEIRALKDKYADQLTILCGLELDYYSDPDPQWGYPVIRRAMADHGPVDAVCIMLGSNDILLSYRADVSEIAGRMDAMINFLQTGWPQVQLVLITPPPLDIPEFPEAEDKLNALIDAYQQLAKERKISFINNHPWNLPLAYDGVHFTETGH